MLVGKLKILQLIAFTSMFIDVCSGLKCYVCDSREQQNCTGKLPYSHLVECNNEYFEKVGLQHLVGDSKSFVCITAHATAKGEQVTEFIFKNCAPQKMKNHCKVVMPEIDDGTLNWHCNTCKKDACNAGCAQMGMPLSLGLFFSLVLLIA